MCSNVYWYCVPIDGESAVEQGETYEHTEYGSVTVTGIWRGVKQVDAARNTTESDVIIVRYSTEQGEGPAAELTDLLDEFVAAVDDTDMDM